MAINGVTFDGTNVSSKQDGGFYQAHIGDGILWGCGMSIYGSPATGLAIDKGEIMAGGRVVEVDGVTNIPLTSTGLTNGYAQIILTINTSNTPPVDYSIVTSANTSFPALTQNAINDSGNIYQLQLAIVQITLGRPSSIYTSLGNSGLQSNGNIWINSDGDRRAVIFYSSGTGVGRLRYNAVTGYTEVGSINNDNTLKAGIRGSSSTEIFADNSSIYLRPVGANNSSNQAYLDASGNLKVSGNVSGAAASFTGNTTLGGTLSATGNTTLGGTLNVTGNTTLGGTLSVNSFDASNNITIDRNGSGTKGFVIKDGGNNVAAFNYNGTYARSAMVDSGGNLVAGMEAKSDTNVLFTANGGTIYLRPNGASSTSHQAYLDSSGVLTLNGGLAIDGNVTVTNGRITGGTTVVEKPFSGSTVNLSGTTPQAIITQTGLTASGIYVVEGQITYSATTATGHHPQVRLGGAYNSDIQARSSTYIESSGTLYLQVFGIITGVTQVVLSASCDQTGMAAAVSGGHIRISRIA